MELSNKRRYFLQNFFMSEIKPLLENYWEKVYELRVKDDSWPKDAPLVDLFKPMQIIDKNTGEKTLNCIMPLEPARPFWDAFLAFYPLFKPDLFPSEGHVARMILDFLPQTLKPVNLVPHTYIYLTQISQGLDSSNFWNYPIEFVPAIKILQLMAINYPKEDSEIPEFEEKVQKWHEQAYEEESVRLAEKEKEFQNILKEEEI